MFPTRPLNWRSCYDGNDVMIEHDQQFETFQAWINKASSWLTWRGPQDHFVCLDAKNRVCRNGGDMWRAHNEGAFPVRWLWPEDVAGMAETHAGQLADAERAGYRRGFADGQELAHAMVDISRREAREDEQEW